MASAAPQKHRRVYQACEPCREAKVRCEPGFADRPTQPPCVRCRRESRECYFAASRNRKAAALLQLAQSSSSGSSQGIKRKTTSLEFGERTVPRRSPQRVAHASSSPPSQNSSELDRRGGQQTPSQFSENAENGRAAAALLKGHPRTYHDALTLLSEACEHSVRAPDDGASRPAGGCGNNNDTSSSLGRECSSAAASGVKPRRPETLQALKAWSNVRFVRGGLFTAEEALDMIDQFYNYQAPFSPIVPECFKEHSQHAALIEDEPILTVTMLMIGSRYCVWSGPAAVARSYIVHDRLWRYLQGMISRLFWSEDNFVGEFTSLADDFSGSYRDSHYSRPGSWSNGFRTLGTCEALLILLDWHPRSLHFPPIDEDTTSIVLREAKKQQRRAAAGYGGPESGHDWLARSDRLCRSMLSAASMLATEIGVFDENEPSINRGYEGVGHNSWETPSQRLRVYRLRQLIWVYATQQPGRPGWRVLTPSPLRPGPGMEKDDTTECWFRVARLMKQANELLFPSHSHTNKIIKSGEYLRILHTFQPLLQDFAVKFDQTKLTKQARSILTIEYSYVRLCIYSVALQAVINRRYYDGGRDGEGPAAAPNISQQEEEEHLTQTVNAAQKILRTVLDELIPDNYMRYIPVRSYSRILGAALFLLKACAAGVREIDIPTSLRLVGGAANAFRTHIIDETSLTPRWGELLDRLSMGLQSRLTSHQAPDQSQNTTAGHSGGGVLPDIHPPDRPLFPDPYSHSVVVEPRPWAVHFAGSHGTSPVSHADMSTMGLNPASVHHQEHNPRLSYATNTEGFTMWWDLLRPSQAMSFNEVPWYPALGIVDSNEGSILQPGVSGEGGMQQTPSGISERLYE